MPEIEERVGIVEHRMDGLEKWRVQHMIDASYQIEALAKLPIEIAVLVAKVSLLIEAQANLWKLIKWLVIALIAMAGAAWGVKEIGPLVLKGGL